MKRLLAIGFEQVGSWRLINQKLALELTRMNAQRNVLYAFVQDSLVLYVGKTTGSLENRMGGYLRPSSTQRTNVRNNQSLLELLHRNQNVDIYAWSDSGNHRIGDFHLNYAAGLEDSIIKTVVPPWNGAPTVNQPRDDIPDLPLSDIVTIIDSAKVADPSSSGHSMTSQENEAASAMEVQALEEAGFIKASPVFEVILGKTYFHNGFFNVPVKFSDAFPEHGTEISVYCGDSRTLIRATVDRKSNQVNHTPRIFGRSSLANWFEHNKLLDAIATVRIVSKNEIELM